MCVLLLVVWGIFRLWEDGLVEVGKYLVGLWEVLVAYVPHMVPEPICLS